MPTESLLKEINELKNVNIKLMQASSTLMDDNVKLMQASGELMDDNVKLMGCMKTHTELKTKLALTEALLITHESIGTKVMSKEIWIKGKNKYLQEHRGKPVDIKI